MQLEILKTDLLPTYLEHLTANLSEAFSTLKDAELSTENFSFYTSVASVFSSKIEGEDIELDSYIKHKKFGVEFLPDYTKKIDDLYNTYIFAKANVLSEENLKKAHQLLTKHILVKHQQGTYRVHNMYVSTPDGRIEYVAAAPFDVNSEMIKLYNDIDTLFTASLTIEEVFFFAAMIHLVFVKIHPWNDGNGRTARLLEKWFIAEKLGEKAWLIQSEKFYYSQHATYYSNIRLLGIEYLFLDYSKSLPFLLMTANSLNQM